MSETQLASLSHFVRRATRGEDFSDEDLAALGGERLTPDSLRALYGELACGDVGASLRRLRKAVLLRLAAKNHYGGDPYAETVAAMTAFARLAVDEAVRTCARELARRFGVPRDASGEPEDLVVFGMGKFGGAELNVSSDIDLVFAFDSDGRCAAQDGSPRTEISSMEFFTRLGKKVIALLSEVTDEGFVFRVDMRLRPNGGAGPLVVSFDMLETYFYSQGREWERFAWLKAEVVSGPVFSDSGRFAQSRAAFMKLIEAFVFRRYVDFGAMRAISSIHGLICEQVREREAASASQGRDIKLGRGGIREIEFYVQAFQLIRGGKQPVLRSRNTLEAIARLKAAGLVGRRDAHELSLSYVFLRNLEHALQFMDDEQTHALPVDPAEFARVAAFLRESREELREDLARVIACVQAKFDALFASGGRADSGDVFDAIVNAGATLNEPTFLKMLRAAGFAFSDEVLARVVALVSGKTAAGQSDLSQRNLSAVLNLGLKTVLEAAPEGPDALAQRFLSFLEVIVGRSTYVALLAQYPPVLKKVVDFLAASGFASDFLMRHPVILDELVNNRTDPVTEKSAVSWEPFKADFRRFVAQNDPDKETLLDALRDAYHASLFRVLAADLEGRLTVERVADHVSALTDAVLELALEAAWRDTPGRHRDKPAFAIVAYGKLGGKERGYTGDLDLVFVYEDAHPEAFRTYVRLARRLMTVLTVQTGAGSLFEVDLRLRPDGEGGPMVASFERFCRYEENADGAGAWLWEHQALTRARFAAGDAELGERFEAEREKVLAIERDPARVFAEIRAMRRKMLEARVPEPGRFDLKRDFGGMIDVEFAVQAAILAYASKKRALLDNFGNNRLLSIMAREGLIPRELAERAAEAYRALRLWQKKVRLASGSAEVTVEEGAFAKERRAIEELFETVLGGRP